MGPRAQAHGWRNGFLNSVFWKCVLHFAFCPRVLVSVKKEQTVTITLDKDMSFSVLLHRVWKKHPINVDFLGIYIPPTNKFSPKAHGLIGMVFVDHLASGSGSRANSEVRTWTEMGLDSKDRLGPCSVPGS